MNNKLTSFAYLPADTFADGPPLLEETVYGTSEGDTFTLETGDRIFRVEGDDLFYATSGGGNVITGNLGADQFWIADGELPESANIITDFTSGEDVIGITGLGIGYDDLTFTQSDAGTVIGANGQDLAIVTNAPLNIRHLRKRI